MAENRRNMMTMDRELIYAMMSAVQDPELRDIGALVSKEWRMIESETRKHVSIECCYSCTPDMLGQRYPCIQSLKVKGKPRAAKFMLPAEDGNRAFPVIPEEWGGCVTPWIQYFSLNVDPNTNGIRMRNLKSIHFKRMYVTDLDLKYLAISHGRILEVLKLENCSGFSTDGLLDIVIASKRNLRILFLQANIIHETETRREWLQALASNKVLESLVFFNTTLQKVTHEDLENLIRKCPNLTSLETSFADINELRSFFSSAHKLREFWSSLHGAAGQQQLHVPLQLPQQLCSLGIGNISWEAMKLLLNGSTASKLTELNLRIGFFNKSGFCELIRLCPNLKLLLANNVIGDDGLVELGKCCRHLRKLRIEVARNEENEVITERGLLAIAIGCKQLEKIAVYSHSLTSDTLSAFGTHSSNLRDFRISMVPPAQDGAVHLPADEIVLDNGVADLLRGCEKLEGFALCFNQLENFFLSDVGLRHIGLYGTKLKWMLLNSVGELRDHKLHNLFVRPSCPNLKKLELVYCQISAAALAEAVLNLPNLKILIVQDFASIIRDIIEDYNALQRMRRPHWHVEYIAPTTTGPTAIAHIHGYWSLVAEPRIDFPPSGSVLPIL